MLMSTPVLCNVRQGSPIAQQAPLPGLSSAYHEIAQAAQNNGLGEMAQTTGFDHDGAISAEQKVQGEVDPVLLSDEQLKDNMRKVPPSDLYKEDLTQKELCAVITKLRGHSVRFPKEGKFLRFLNAAVCDKELRKRKEKGANFLKGHGRTTSNSEATNKFSQFSHNPANSATQQPTAPSQSLQPRPLAARRGSNSARQLLGGSKPTAPVVQSGQITHVQPATRLGVPQPVQYPSCPNSQPHQSQWAQPQQQQQQQREANRPRLGSLSLTQAGVPQQAATTRQASKPRRPK
eukprot:jgi/Chrzof1/9471/Cz04g04100.t1